jgi:hypothetical protein
VARVWHEGAVIQQAMAERISKNIFEQQKIRADDGNRTRMTSLEGVLHLAVRRLSWAIRCLAMTVIDRCLPGLMAR